MIYMPIRHNVTIIKGMILNKLSLFISIPVSAVGPSFMDVVILVLHEFNNIFRYLEIRIKLTEV